MNADCALIFYYHRLNCYSFNALAGALDSSPDLSETPVTLATHAEALRAAVTAALERHSRVVVCLSVMTCQFDSMRRLMRQLRSEGGANLVLLAGGPHVTACPEDTLAAGADVAFRGEAEAAFPVVFRNILHGQPVNPVPSSPDPICIDSYASISPKRGMFGPIEITRGCAFACSYCQTSRIFGTQLRHRGIESILRQAASLQSGNRRVVRLLSPNAFSYDRRRPSAEYAVMRELQASLRKTVRPKSRMHLPTSLRGKAGAYHPGDLDLFRELQQREIVIGAQSGSRAFWNIANGRIRSEDVLTAVSLARKYGYKDIVDFIYGLPRKPKRIVRESLV
jgi:radical SAM superfamily enzyme YgiQ (UPF0313 family)